MCLSWAGYLNWGIGRQRPKIIEHKRQRFRARYLGCQYRNPPRAPVSNTIRASLSASAQNPFTPTALMPRGNSDPNRTGSTVPPPRPMTARAFLLFELVNASLYYSNTIDAAWVKSTNDRGRAYWPHCLPRASWRADNVNRAAKRNLIFVLRLAIGTTRRLAAVAGQATLAADAFALLLCRWFLATRQRSRTRRRVDRWLVRLRLHALRLEWLDPVDPAPAMAAVSNTWVYTLTVPANATQFDCVFNNCAGGLRQQQHRRLAFQCAAAAPQITKLRSTPFWFKTNKFMYTGRQRVVGTIRVILIPSNASFNPHKRLGESVASGLSASRLRPKHREAFIRCFTCTTGRHFAARCTAPLAVGTLTRMPTT